MNRAVFSERRAAPARTSFFVLALLARPVTATAQQSDGAPRPAPSLAPSSSSHEPRVAGHYLVGQPIDPGAPRPADTRGVLRSHRAPVAIHASAETAFATIVAAHDAAVRALDALEHEQQLPLPAPDGTHGGGPELDVYLVDPPAQAARALAATTTSPASSSSSLDGEALLDALEYGALWDRASAFVRVRRDLEPDALARAVTEGITQAALLGIDARAPRPLRIALAAALADRSTHQGPDLSAIARFQRDPGAALVAHRDDASSRGASLFLNYLAAHYDDESLTLLRGLAWGTVARTHDSATPVYADEPDVFDLLERLFRDERGGIDAVLADFALARARAGSSEDTLVGMNLDDPALRPDGVTLEYDRLPTWVTPTRPTEETGAFYLTIRTRNANDRGINAWFHGAPWRRWAVTAVRIDGDDRIAGRAPPSHVERGEWSFSLPSLRDTDRVLIVVSDLGNGDYDPDEIADRTGFFALNLARDE